MSNGKLSATLTIRRNFVKICLSAPPIMEVDPTIYAGLGRHILTYEAKISTECASIGASRCVDTVGAQNGSARGSSQHESVIIYEG